jgi:Holliday junction DNA helicase RuvA
MIASLTGTLVSKSPNAAVVDVHGVGYRVFVPLSTFYLLPEEKKSVTLLTHTHVREDALQLYGFLRNEEKAVFLALIGVSGVGPKLALNILSGLPLEDFVKAVRAGDVARLSLIPGVGKKTAERLALELKDKIATAMPSVGATPGMESTPSGDSTIDDAVSALVNLGYKSAEAREAVKRAAGGEAVSIESLIKAALKTLSK